MIIQLNDFEVKLIDAMARWRNHKARSAGILDRMIDTERSSIDIDIEGMKGEWAAAKYFGFSINFILKPQGDGGIFDFNRDDYLVEVKSTRYKQGKLILGMTKQIKADAYVLAIVDGNEVELVGAISGQRFREEATIQCLNGFTKCRAVDQERLAPIEMLKDRLEGVRRDG